ncbi:MAG: hypothetical protein HON90_01905 [Halobacteriovoraceae bacterium]|jgi:hypothetical protein|nr:hypothetical protein [Halobacteriovoraceae bacterium]
MSNIPLHPLIVHFTMGVVLILPIITCTVLLLIHLKKATGTALLFVLIVHAGLAVSVNLSSAMGERDERVIAKLTDKNSHHQNFIDSRLIDNELVASHEEEAGIFMIINYVFLLISIGLYGGKLSTIKKIAILFMQSLLIYFAYNVATSGGKLVYLHGAAKAFINLKFGIQ